MAYFLWRRALGESSIFMCWAVTGLGLFRRYGIMKTEDLTHQEKGYSALLYNNNNNNNNNRHYNNIGHSHCLCFWIQRIIDTVSHSRPDLVIHLGLNTSRFSISCSPEINVWSSGYFLSKSLESLKSRFIKITSKLTLYQNRLHVNGLLTNTNTFK